MKPILEYLYNKKGAIKRPWELTRKRCIEIAKECIKEWGDSSPESLYEDNYNTIVTLSNSKDPEINKMANDWLDNDDHDPSDLCELIILISSCREK